MKLSPQILSETGLASMIGTALQQNLRLAARPSTVKTPETRAKSSKKRQDATRSRQTAVAPFLDRHYCIRTYCNGEIPHAEPTSVPPRAKPRVGIVHCRARANSDSFSNLKLVDGEPGSPGLGELGWLGRLGVEVTIWRDGISGGERFALGERGDGETEGNKEPGRAGR